MQDNAVSENDLTTFFARIYRLDQVLEGIIRDEKPSLDPRDPDESWIYEILTRMHAGLFVSEDPKTFVTLPGEGREEIESKGILRAHPLHYSLVEEESRLGDILHKDNIYNFKVLGMDAGTRFAGRNPRDLFDYADSFVLTRGDYQALYEFVTLLKAKIGLEGEPESTWEDKLLVLRNSSGFWDPLIQGLGLDRLGDYFKDKANFHVETSTRDIDHVLRAELGEWAERKPKSSRDTLRIKAGSHDLMISGNTKKLHEWPEIFRMLQANVDVLSFNNMIGLPREAEETSRTYSGNCIEKIEQAAALIDALGQEQVRAILAPYGIDPENVVIRAEDRGMTFAEDLFADAVFDDIRYRLNPHKMQPGAELAHVLHGMSNADMYARLKIAAKNLAEKREREGDPRPVDLTVLDYANTSLTTLLPDSNGERVIYSFSGATEDTLAFDPRPASDPEFYSEHYLIPKNYEDERTKAEIPDYIESQSCMALSARAMARTTGLDTHRHLQVSAEFKNKARERYTIATQHSLIPATRGHGVKGLPMAVDQMFRFEPGRDGKYDLTQPRDYEVKVKGGGTRVFRSTLNNIHGLMMNAQAFVLTPEAKREDYAKYFWERMFFSLSVTVAKQTFDRTLANKPFAVLNLANGQDCKDFETLFRHLHHKGMIGDKPGHIYNKKESPKTLAKFLRDRAMQYTPAHVPRHEYEESGTPCPKDLDRITVYCAAKFNNAEMDDMAFNLAYMAADNGFALKNGGGKGGLMYQTSLGYLQRRKDWIREGRGNMPRTHITSIQCAETRQMEGLCDFNDLIKVYPNIFFRMDDLTDTENEIVLPGGAGSWQEPSGSVILRRAGLRPVEDHPLIFVDCYVGHGRHRTKVFEPIIEMMPWQDVRDVNIHVVEDQHQAMDIVIAAREERRRKALEADLRAGRPVNLQTSNDNRGGGRGAGLRGTGTTPSPS